MLTLSTIVITIFLYFGDRLMTKQRKQIIINEITFWKQNRLLPEHYCDFLMTLYTEGEHAETEMKGDSKQSVKAKERRKINAKYIIIPIIGISFVAAIYFVPITWLILALSAIFVLLCMVLAVYYMKKNDVLAPVLQLTAAVVLLFATIKLCLTYFPGNDIALYVALIGNCSLWLLSGIFMRLMYFTIAGGLGLLAIVIYSSI